MELYPLKFKPILKEKVWGGSKLKSILHKDAPDNIPFGESWELSGLSGSSSVVTNGYLAGNSLEELIEVYMDELVGEKVYETFGLEFPILIKFLDASDILSLQVHPNNEEAEKRHHAYGKAELWYVLDAAPNSEIILGFNKNISKEEFLKRLKQHTLNEVTNFEKVKPEDAFFVDAGIIHAIGKNVLLLEISQTSDITYRLHDWNRNDERRELHLDLAEDVINYNAVSRQRLNTQHIPNNPHLLLDSPFFTTNLLEIDKDIIRNYEFYDSFITYVCIEGEASLQYNGGNESISKGETILIPASISDITIVPQGSVKLIETYL